MGTDAYIETESGKRIKQCLGSEGRLSELLPDIDDDTFHCLRFIDPYGDTVFNQRQIPILIKELRTVIRNVKTPETKAFGEKLLELIREAEGQVHTYIKFYGD